MTSPVSCRTQQSLKSMVKHLDKKSSLYKIVHKTWMYSTLFWQRLYSWHSLSWHSQDLTKMSRYRDMTVLYSKQYSVPWQSIPC